MPLGQQMEGRATSSGLDSPVRTKVAIVTGASRGIGRGIAERLLETGYCVVANSRNITSAKTLQPRDRLKLVDGDIASHNVAKQVVDSAIGSFGRIDLLVNTPMHQVEAPEFLKQLSPLNRLAEIAEVVDLVLFLESAPFINGEVIHLDGGAHAGKW